LKFVLKIGGSLLNYRESLNELCNVLGTLASHRMAILAMDQYGILLADITPNSTIIHTLNDVEKVWETGNSKAAKDREIDFGKGC